MKSPFLTLALFILVSRGLMAADTTPLAQEKPILMAPFIVQGHSAQETGLAISTNMRRLKNSSALVIDEPIVTGVAPGSVAATAGIARGDRLVQIGDLKLAGLSPTRWHEEFVKSHDGQTVMFTIRKRDSHELRLLKFRFQRSPTTVTPASATPPAAQEPRRP